MATSTTVEVAMSHVLFMIFFLLLSILPATHTIVYSNTYIIESVLQKKTIDIDIFFLYINEENCLSHSLQSF